VTENIQNVIIREFILFASSDNWFIFALNLHVFLHSATGFIDLDE